MTMRFLAAVMALSFASGGAAQTCEPTAGRHTVAIPVSSGGTTERLGGPHGFAEIYGEHEYVQPLENGWVFALRRRPDGWQIGLYEHGALGDAVDLTSITPPHHGPANPRELLGWHFRNANNTGPNQGEVNAPGALRLFMFSPALVGTGGFKPSIDPGEPRLTPPDPADGRGWLQVHEQGLTQLNPGQRARMNYLKFQACLSWPITPIDALALQRQEIATERRQRALDDASPNYASEEVETLGSCGLDLSRFEMKSSILPRLLAGDLDGDGAFDEVFQVQRKRDGKHALALCRAGTWLHLLGLGAEQERDQEIRFMVDRLEAWQLLDAGHGRLGYVGEPPWPAADGDVLVLERVEKAKLLIYWHAGQLHTQYAYRYVEP